MHNKSPAEAQASTGERKIRYEEEGKRRGVLFPSQRRGAQYGSFRTLEGRNEEHSLHFEDLQHVFVVRFA